MAPWENTVRTGFCSSRSSCTDLLLSQQRVADAGHRPLELCLHQVGQVGGVGVEASLPGGAEDSQDVLAGGGVHQETLGERKTSSPVFNSYFDLTDLSW